jgi:hypothetical protein
MQAILISQFRLLPPVLGIDRQNTASAARRFEQKENALTSPYPDINIFA